MFFENRTGFKTIRLMETRLKKLNILITGNCTNCPGDEITFNSNKKYKYLLKNLEFRSNQRF